MSAARGPDQSHWLGAAEEGNETAPPLPEQRAQEPEGESRFIIGISLAP